MSGTLGKRIKVRREGIGMTQGELAGRAEIRQPSLSDIEADKTKEVTAKTLAARCRELGIRWEYALYGTGPVEASEIELELLEATEHATPRLLKDRLREAIESTGQTKADIARQCGVTDAAVTFWISGATKTLQAEKALALERATGYRSSWLIRGTGPRRIADAEQRWPFPMVAFARFARLPKDDQGYVQRRLLQAIQECERPDGPTP